MLLPVLGGLQAVAAGETQLRRSVSILSAGSQGADMEQVKVLKPDVPSGAVASNVFMT